MRKVKFKEIEKLKSVSQYVTLDILNFKDQILSLIQHCIPI